VPINEYDETLQEIGQSPDPLPKSPAPNPYDQTVEQLDQAREQQLRKSLIDASATPADRAAQIEKLSQRTGIPSAIVDRNFDDIRKRATIAETPYTEMLRDTPVLTDWLTQKPEHAAVAHDDLESLGFIEWLTKAPLRAWTQGQAQVRYGFLRNQELYRDLTPAEREQLASDKTAMEAGGQLGAGTSWFRKAVTGSAQNLPNMIGAWVYGLKKGIPGGVTAGTLAAIAGQLGPQVATPEEVVTVPTAFAGGMAAGMYVGAGEFTSRIESGLAYDEYLNFRDEFGQPLDPRVAKAAALATGYANGALEAIGLEFLFKSIPGLDKLAGVGSRNAVKLALRQPGVRAALLEAVKSYGETITAEASTEVAQRAMTILSGELAKATGAKATPKGQTAQGNVNLYQQPTVQNADGSVSTVDSVSIDVDGKEVLIPRVTPDGRHLTTEEAIAEFRKTGQNLGTFDSPENANAFAEQLHKDYAAGTYSQPGPMRTPSDVGKDLMNEGLGALQSFALTVAPGPIAQLGLGVARARSAQANVRFFQALGEGAAASKTGQRLPEALQSFVEQATKDGPVANVYADVDTWTKYWQEQGVDPAAVATEVTGSRDAYEHALNTGEHLEIPTGRYAVKLAATEHNGFWVNELRLGPDQMNGREAALFEEQIAQLAQAEAQPGPAAQVKQQLVQQLTAAGYEPATAESYATLYESAFGAMAERAGLDPAAVFQQYGLNVTRGDGENAAPAARQVEPATPPLPGLIPTTDDSGQLVTPAPAAADGAAPAGGTPAAQGESGASAVVAPGAPAGSGGSSAAPAASAPAEPGTGASAATAPSPTLTLPATPHDVADAVTAALAGLQGPVEGATLAGDGPQGNAHDAAGDAGSIQAADSNPTGAAPVGRGDELPGAVAQRRSPGALGAEPAGRTQGGARKGRAVKLPAGFEPRFAALLDGARSLGYTGDDRSLAKLFTAAIAQARTYAADLNAVESDDEQAGSLDLLKLIASAGGIGIEAEAGSSEYSKRRKGKVLGNGGATGELENMLESLARSGKSKKTGKAMPRQFMRSGGLPGVPGIIVRKGGMTADQMREHVQQDPRWQHLENLSDFLSAVDDAIRIETGTSERPGSTSYTVESVLSGLLNVRPDTDWWNTAAPIENNGSGESAASLEAINRDASMKARGERFVVYDRTGARRVLIGVDAVDYVARQGETYGVEGPAGFRVLDDLGGKAPAATVTNLLHEDAILNGDLQGPDAGDDVTFDISEFDQGLFDELTDDPSDGIDRYTTGELQPRLPGAEHVRDQEVAQPEIADLLFSLTPPPVKGEKRKAAELPPSEEYLAAKAAADASSAALREATLAYRARTIGDDEYLAARHADDQAQAAFDVATDRERARGRSTTTLFQSGPVTDDTLKTWAAELRDRTGPDLVALDLRMNPNGNVQLETLAIARGATRAGLGTAVMHELTKFADAHGLTIELALADKGYNPIDGAATTSSKDRLRKFYARFGFVSNKGRYKNYALSIYTSMYRDPSAKAGKAGLVTPPAPVKQTETPAFKAWFGESKVVDDSGEPIVVFHGTTHNFTEFDTDRGNIESDFGRGIYFSNTPEDVSANYAGEGPDLTSRITQRAEQIASETDREYNDPEVIAEARAELVGEHKGAILPVYLRFENPAILGGDNETRLTYDSEYAPLSDFEDDDVQRLRDQGLDDDEIRRELSDEYGLTEQKGTLLDFVNALRSSASRYDDGDVEPAIESIEGQGMDGDLTLRAALTIVRESQEFNYYTGDRGEMVSHEIIRLALERAGYDGIIDATVDEKFGSQRRIGRGMEGMHGGTVHYIAFEPEQIKSAIGNRGTFNRNSANILEQGGGRRGFIRFGADRQFNINLLERADLSTFLHETGHFYLEVFGDLRDQVLTIDEGARTLTQQQLVADYDRLLAWFSTDDKDVRTRADIGEAEHEKFARGFEAYLLEGNAPSVELRSAFARFRAWLVAIYKSIKSLRIDLTDDVRRVLDRMVATDKAIFAAEQEGRVAPMFTTPDAAGMTDTQFGLYRAAVAEAARASREKLERRVMGEVAREQQAEWTRRRQELRNQVAMDVNERAVYQALAAMQHGTRPDGTPLLDETTTEPVKLSRAKLVELFGADRLKRLPKPYIYTTQGGADPEVVARMFGFSSADDMLTKIEQAPPAKAVIEHETTQRMIAEHGSVLLDGTLHDKAREAVATEEREVLIRAELRALANLRNIAAPFVKAGDERVKAERDERAYERRWMDAERKLEVALAKKEKQAEIDRLREEVKTLRARARGGAAAIRAALPPTGILEEQARQRLASTRVRDLAPARYWSASRQAAQRALDTAARQDFAGAIEAKQQELINLHLYRQASDLRDMIEQRVKKIREQATTRGFQRLGLAGDGYLEQYQGILERYSFTPASQPALDRRTSLREWVQEREEAGLPVELPDDVMDEVRRTPYQNLTTEEFIGVADALDNIAHIAQLERRRLKAADDRTFFEARDAVVASIDANNPERPKRLEFTAKDERGRAVSDWFASHSKLSFLARALDGYQDGGQLWDAIVRPLNAAADEEFTRSEAAGKAYGAIVRQAYGNANLSAKLFIPAIDDSLSHEARVAVALQWGNENGRERLTNDPVRKWDRSQVLAILDTLDKRDWDFVQATFDYLNGFWPDIAAKQERVTGLAPEKVEALPIETKYGQYAGGYYPLAYDGRMVPRAEQAKAASEAKLAATAAYVRTTTRRGHTETRKRTVRLPVRLDLSVAFEHINQVIHDLTHHEALIDVTRMLRDGKVSQSIVEHAGDVVYQQFTKAVQDIALGYVPGRGILDRAATFMRTGTQLSLLGWNLWTSAQQPLGIFNGAAEVGPRWVARGLKRWLRDAASMENTLTWISDVSPFMRSRTANATQDLNDLRTKLHQPGGWFDRLVRTVTLDAIGKENIVNSYLWHIGVMQRVADVPTWLGAYEKAMALEGGAEESRAIALADQAVRNAQGGGSMVDLAQVQRGTPIARAFMTFYSYGNVVFNQTKDAIGRTSFRSPAQVAGLLGNLSLVYLMPALATVTLGHAVGKMTGDEPEDWAADLGREMLSTALNTMVLVRELTGLTEKEIRGYAGPAGARTFELFYRAVQQMEQGKLDEGLVKALNSLAGTLLRYPAAQVQRTADGATALEEGRTSNPFVLLFGAPPKNAKK
jgi:ribosomal protein S18 acetylase RimI-like enzyme